MICQVDTKLLAEFVFHVTEFPAQRNVITYLCCPQNPFVDLTFTIRIRRRRLYYLFNIVAPCMLFAMLGVFTFTLPPDAGEKISFSKFIMMETLFSG